MIILGNIFDAMVFTMGLGMLAFALWLHCGQKDK
jgi:hypothetical protein